MNTPKTVTYKGKEYIINYRYERAQNSEGQIKSSGGKTIAFIEEKLTTVGENPSIVRYTVLQSEAICSKKDNFNKKLGRHIAAGRLVKLAQQPDEIIIFD